MCLSSNPLSLALYLMYSDQMILSSSGFVKFASECGIHILKV